MKKLMLMVVCAMAVVICCKLKVQAASANGGNDLLTSDVALATDIDKHSEAYIRQRLDIIYGSIRQRVAGGSYMGQGFNPDSAYCSSCYYGLLKQALDISDETGEIVFDYDHWVCGQDFSEDWNYQIRRAYDITDSTALADITVVNFGTKQDVTLSLLFERGDWYINEFGPEDAEESDKAYFRRFIADGLKTREKAKTLVGEWGWVGDDGPELILNLKMTDHGLKAEQCDIYRMYGFDNTMVTFDGQNLSVTESEYDRETFNTIREFSLFVRFDEQGDLTGTCRIVHPLANKEYNGSITLRKGYFKYSK